MFSIPKFNMFVNLYYEYSITVNLWHLRFPNYLHEVSRLASGVDEGSAVWEAEELVGVVACFEIKLDIPRRALCLSSACANRRKFLSDNSLVTSDSRENEVIA